MCENTDTTMQVVDLETDTVSSLCRCDGCQIKGCECHGLCGTYRPIYDRIIESGKYTFLTWAPKPRTESHYECTITNDYDDFKQFFKSYFKKNKYIKDYIVVAELTKKCMLHMHCFFSFTNKVSIIKTICQPLYYKGNILNLWMTKPKLGIHYLFKEHVTMKEYFDGELPVFTSAIAI